MSHFLKPIGSKEELVSESPYTPDYVSFAPIGKFKASPKIREGNILILHAIGSGKLIGYFKAVSEILLEPDNIRYPFRIKVECLSTDFSNNWWHKNLNLYELANEYGITLGAIQRGCTKLLIPDYFAFFLIRKINNK